MKVGIEVEGVHCGNPMIFCDALEVVSMPEKILAAAKERAIDWIYISDNENVLEYSTVATLFPFPDFEVTMDVTKVKGLRPENINLMLRLDGYDEVAKLSEKDQVKFERDRNVRVFSLEHVVITAPHDFDADEELA